MTEKTFLYFFISLVFQFKKKCILLSLSLFYTVTVNSRKLFCLHLLSLYFIVWCKYVCRFKEEVFFHGILSLWTCTQYWKKPSFSTKRP